jgi:hypothetical protein
MISASTAVVWHVRTFESAATSVYISAPAEAEGVTRSPPECLPGTREGVLPPPRLLRGRYAVPGTKLASAKYKRQFGHERECGGAGLKALDMLRAPRAQAEGAWFSRGASRCFWASLPGSLTRNTSPEGDAPCAVAEQE